jgi:hypothetical protein
MTLNRIAWLNREIVWTVQSGLLACAVPVDCGGLLELAAVGSIVVPGIAPKGRRMMSRHMRGPRESVTAVLLESIERLSPPTKWWRDAKPLTVFCHGIFSLQDEGRVCIVVGLTRPDIAQSWLPLAAYQEAESIWKTHLVAVAAWEIQEKERKISSDEFVSRMPADRRSEMKKSLDFGETLRPYDKPLEPTLEPLLTLLPVGVWIPSIREAEPSREHQGQKALNASRIGPSRDGSYHGLIACTVTRKKGALITWTPRGALPSYPELRAAVQAILPSALQRPRRSDVSPPDFDTIIVDPNVPTTIVDLGPLDGDGWDQLVDGVRDIRPIDSEMVDRAARAHDRLTKRGFEAVGWYQPFHVWNEETWGIYLDADKLLDLACGLHTDLSAEGNQSFGLAILLAIGLVYQHEVFHARVEACSTWNEVTSRRAKHFPYQKAVYQVLRETDAWHEEALANWWAWSWFSKNGESLRQQNLLRKLETAEQTIKDWLSLSPPGYRTWRIGDDPVTWYLFATELVSGKHSSSAGKRPFPIASLLDISRYIDFRTIDIPTRLIGEGLIVDVLQANPATFGTPSRREAERALKNYFHYVLDTRRGKGSHELWIGPDNRGFPLPQTDPLSRTVFKNFLDHFDLNKEKYVREVRPSL